MNASAAFVNCTIDADRARRATEDVPSEFYAQFPGSVLNMTFVNLTNCHKDLIELQDPGAPGHPDHKVS